MTKTFGLIFITINVTEDDAMKLLSKQEWLFRLLNPFLCVVKLKLLLEAVIDSSFALAEISSKGDPAAVLYTFEEQTPETTERQLSSEQ